MRENAELIVKRVVRKEKIGSGECGQPKNLRREEATIEIFTHPRRVAAFDVSRGKLRFRRQVRIVLSQRLLKLQFYGP